MDNSYIKNNLEEIFESFKEMIKVETVVGQAVHIGDAILVPFVDVTFGFGSGGVNGKTENGRSSAGSGGGAKMEPAAIPGRRLSGGGRSARRCLRRVCR